MNYTVIKRVALGLFFALFALLCVFLFLAWRHGHFDSLESMQEYISGFGSWAPMVLTGFQAAQVVLPVLPGWLGCMAGGMLFGTLGGFLCNYIGICTGSLIAFVLAKRYGRPIVDRLFTWEKYDRLMEWGGKSRSFARFLFIATLLPLFPDDFLCYASGLTEMKFSKFTWIILLGKPWCILAYSIIFSGALF